MEHHKQPHEMPKVRYILGTFILFRIDNGSEMVLGRGFCLLINKYKLECITIVGLNKLLFSVDWDWPRPNVLSSKKPFQ